MKKIISFILLLICSIFCLAGCGEAESSSEGFQPIAKEDIKIGMICLHDINSTYDKNFIESMKSALTELGMSEDQLELVTGVPEGEQCYSKACELAATCDIVFADSFGHEDYLIQAAQENPSVRFCHATGEKAAVTNLDNYSNAFAAIYEGRYLAGVIAGMKVNELNEGKEEQAKNYKIGYVGAFSYAEVISGYTSFYLGVKSVCPEATMVVKYTGSWFDVDREYATANALINNENCCLISQHADSYGAPTACEENGIPNVSYNGSTETECPNTFIASTRINWSPYFKYIIQQTIAGEKIDHDWVGDFETGSVEMIYSTTKVAEETKTTINSIIDEFKAGTRKVYDVSTFTVDGKTLTEYMANVIPDTKYENDTNVLKTEGTVKYIAESVFRSAPYFNTIIDGITIIE